MIRILQSRHAGRLLARKAARLAEAEAVVRPILDAVRRRGDRALLEYARRFDGLERKSVRVPPLELAAAQLTPQFRKAVATATANIRRYARLQMPREWSRRIAGGVTLGQVVRPLDTVAAYIPSGRYPLPSTLLMTVVPAQVAGVANICVATPRPGAEIFGTAALLGLEQVFQMGGAQAIAAFAFGTRTVPRAARIVGPGNIYVAAAKKLLAGEVGIDFVAGPTEILIIAEEGDPRHLAADMLAQAEHDVDASAILLTTSRRLAAAVAAAIDRQLADLPTALVARRSIARNSAIVLVASLDEALDVANRFAPEHLSLPDASLLAGVRHAGSVFIGPFSPEAAGDYASGPNHVLPTSGAARTRGGLSVADFVKVISVQELSAKALAGLAPAITTLARAEGLEAHARSVEIRLWDRPPGLSERAKPAGGAGLSQGAKPAGGASGTSLSERGKPAGRAGLSQRGNPAGGASATGLSRRGKPAGGASATGLSRRGKPAGGASATGLAQGAEAAGGASATPGPGSRP